MVQDTSHAVVSLDGIIDPEDVFNEVTMSGYSLERGA
jgi:hypothetical protein